VTRGAAGTTAATHLTAAAISRNVAPAPVVEASLAFGINYVEQSRAGYTRTAGARDNASESGGTGVVAAVAAAVEAAYQACGRKGRIGVA
jgi:hypothetical protein